MTHGNGVAVRDTILWVEDTGEAHLPPVLCLHSLFLDGSMFEELTHGARGRFRVIRPDFRGQGSSAPSTRRVVTMEECASDMLALIDAMGLTGVHLVAASMGGDVSARMAAARPELFRSMVMLGSSVRSEPAEQRARFASLLESTAANGFHGETLDLLMSIMFGATTRARPEMARVLEHWRARIERLPRSAWPAMVGVVERGDASTLLPRVEAPTLIINGEDDIARPPEWAQEVARGIPGAKLTLLKGVGHSPILEAPERALLQVLEFMTEREIDVAPANRGSGGRA